jgi:transglutaminase-like putative cysteine protease
MAAPAWSESVSGQLIMEFDLSAHDPTEETNLWLPYPVSDEQQTISNVQISGDYSNSAVYTDKANLTTMLHAVWNKRAKSQRLTLKFDVERKEMIRRDFPGKETVWDPADYAQYLAPTRLGPIDGVVGELSAKIVKGKIAVLDKARAIYDWAVENTYRNPNTIGCGEGDVCYLLKDPGGKCADISSIYVALARAAGVPTREVFGIRQGNKDGQDITGWQHCWAEFYLPGYGWVPVDPADVRKAMLKENLNLEDAKTDTYRDYFFGGIDAYRIRLSEGRDLTLTPPQQGETVNYLMYPFAQVGSKTLNWLDPKSFKYRIIYNTK